MRKTATGMAAALAVTLAWSGVQAAKTLEVAVPSNLNTFDPAKTKIGEEYNVNFLVFDGLTIIDRNMNLQPRLANSWETSDDLKTWTFHLREGIKFHDGSDFDAQDVIATVKHILDKSVGSSSRVYYLVVDRMEAPDPHTVVFHLNTPYAGFAEVLASRHSGISPSEKIDTQATDPVGTGPFEFKTFSPGDRVELVRNADYWQQGVPKVDGVTFRIMPETAARITALKTGEADVVWDLPLESIEEARQAEGVTVDSVPTSSWDGIIMHNGQPPFDDVRVRQAVAYAVDKKKLVDIALFGNGSPTHSPIPPASPLFNDELPIRSPDIQKAKQLLADAGHPDGFEITLFVPEGRPNRVRVGVATREFLKPIGIQVNLQRVPWDQFIHEIEGKAQFYVDGFYSRPTVDTSTYPWYHSQGSWNDRLWHYENDDMDELLDAARQVRSEAERTKMYKKFQELAVHDVPGVIPYVLNHANAYRDRVEGLHSSPMMWLNLAEASLSE